MKKILLIEFRRLFRSIPFYAAIMIGLFFAINHLIQYIYPLAKINAMGVYKDMEVIPHSVYANIFDNWQLFALINIAPLLVVVPFGYSYYLDKKNGYVKNIFTRTNKYNYIISKYIVTFISGGLVLSIPWIAHFAGCLVMLPCITPIAGSHLFPLEGILLWSKVFYTYPALYMLIFFIRCFIIGGFLACMCLSATYIVNGIFLVLLFPFIYITVYNIVTPLFDKKITLMATQNILEPQNSTAITSIFQIIAFIVIIGIVSIVYFVCTSREDCL